MYLGSERPKRRDSPWRVLVLVVLIIGGLYIVREQIGGADWTRPFDPTPTPARSAASYFDEAEALYDEGLLDDAIERYKSALQADPEDNIALFRLVRLMVIRGRTAEALLQYGTRLQQEDVADARTLAVLGMALDWHAVFNDEKLMPVYLELGVVEQAEVQAPDWVYSREKMARDLVRAAQKFCERAIRLDADLPEAYAYLAEALADRERYDEAESMAQTAVELNPNVPDTQRALGYVYEVQGKYEQAIDAYKAAIEAHPRLGFLHIAVGSNYRAIGYRLQLEDKWDEAMPYFEQAVTYFEQAIKLDPSDPLSYDEIGWTFGHYMGEDREVKQRGLDYLEEALAQGPDYALAYRHIGQVYYDLQNYEEAIAAFDKALELGDLSPTDAIWSHILTGWSCYVLDRDEKGPEQQCSRALPHFKAAWDILEELPQRELGLEYQAMQGLQACE
jgi:tetratricopeptide (TPR) repeat protein